MSSGFREQFLLNLDWLRRPEPGVIPAENVEIDGRSVPILYERNERAKRYLLRIDRDGQVRVTIPRRGSFRQAQQFVRGKNRWLMKNLRRFSTLPKRGAPWHAGHEVYLRGRLTPLELHPGEDRPTLRLGEELTMSLPVDLEGTANLRPLVESHLLMLAGRELCARTVELAARHGVAIERIRVRSQVSRWGSCSSTGTISLNWRLIQTPTEVSDYVILHELMHRRELNHSARFWDLVAQACPDHEACERWLKEHGRRIL